MSPKCCDAQQEPQRPAPGVIIAKCAAMRQSSVLRVRGVDKTVEVNVFFGLRILSSETIKTISLIAHLLTSIRSSSSANPLPTHQSSGSNVTTGRKPNDQHQSSNHPALTSQLRAHGLSSDDRSTIPPQSPNVPYTDYAFVDSQQLLSLPSEDVAFLASKGSLSLPASNAIDEFAQQYFKHIHPLVPVLDEAKFWRICRNNQPTGAKISLFVLQSLIFASCPVSVVPPVTPAFKLNHISLCLWRHCVNVGSMIGGMHGNNCTTELR
jgi:hypothetical protein